MILKPRAALKPRRVRMMTGVYAATYLAANTIDTVATEAPAIRKRRSVACDVDRHHGVNASACIAKDVAFAKMYGGSGAGKKAMPFASYGLFLSRLITIFSPITLPKMLAKGMSSERRHGSGESRKRAPRWSRPSPCRACARRSTCSPKHVQRARRYCSGKIRDVGRVAATVVAFGIRMAPAFGIGGILNAALVDAGHAAVCGAPVQAPAGPP